MLRNWLIHFFGGYSQAQYDTFGRECIRIAREDATKYIQEVTKDRDHEREYYQHELDKKNIEIRRLTDLMLIEHGVIPRETETRTNDKPMMPINGRRRWQQIQKDLEVKDYLRDAKEKADYWKKKNEAQSSAS